MKKCVLITGCSSGIGKATAIYFQRQGWNVVATMRSPEKETELNQLENVLVERLDVTSKKSIDLAIENSIRKFGRIDVLVNNAGVGIYSIFEETDEQVIRESFEINIFGTMWVIRALLPHFRKNGSGRIINVTSTIPHLGSPLTTLYCSTKKALEGLSDALYYELIPLGVRIILVQPGSTKTNIAMQHEFPAQAKIDEYTSLLKTAVESYQHRFESEEIASPDEPAKVIFEAAVSKSDRYRFISGRDAKMVNLMRRLLPEHTLKKLASKMLGLNSLA
jgi:NAD(P)-dependent dehydrogenase (short-subunit alcohol dehydrogenase family)